MHGDEQREIRNVNLLAVLILPGITKAVRATLIIIALSATGCLFACGGGGAKPPTGTAADATAVAPSGGMSGDQVSFSATITGTAPITYAWDFGGGATPNTSSATSPTVTLGAEGTYSAKVTVDNAFGEVDTYAFSLVVTEFIGVAAAVTAVSPLQCQQQSAVTFSATVTGSGPLDYLWDFGGGCTPDTSVSASPSVIANGLGNYTGSVTVDNDYGGPATLNFSYDVVESNGWPTDPTSLNWLNTWYLPLPGLAGPNRVFQDASHRELADNLLTLINNERQQAGAPAVVFDPHMEAVGQANCWDMSTTGLEGHINSAGMGPKERVDAVNPPEYTFGGFTHGENTGRGYTTPGPLVTAWMGSPLHRLNMLSPAWTHVGIGVYTNPSDPSGYKIYWVTEFITYVGDPLTQDWIEPGESAP